MLYPSHTVNGVSLTDAKGRWHEGPGSEVLAAFPGARNAGTQMPGVAGVVARTLAPHEQSIVTLTVIVNAVDDKGVKVSGIGARTAAVNKNMDALLLGIGLGMGTTSGAAINIDRAHSFTESRTATVSAGGSFTPTYVAGADHAEVQLLFNNPTGVWRSGWADSQGIAPGAGPQIPSIDGSTAPIQDSMVGITGPATNPVITNERGDGFQLLLTVPAGKSVVVNTRLWAYGDTLTGAPQWGTTQSYRAALRPIGAITGRALTIIPRPGGGRVSFQCSGANGNTKATVHAKKAWY